MKARRFNSSGIDAFRNYIERLRAGLEEQVPLHFLQIDEYCEEISIDIDIDPSINFDSRYDLGKYLVGQLPSDNISEFVSDEGFWTWLALVWFEQFCPKQKGKLKPGHEEVFILQEHTFKRPRHYVYMTWLLVHKYGKSAGFLLSKKEQRGHIIEVMMGTQEYFSYEPVIELANELYGEKNKVGFKTGATSRKRPGNIERYLVWLSQIRLTYDISSMELSKMKEMLPPEFDVWAEKPKKKKHLLDKIFG